VTWQNWSFRVSYTTWEGLVLRQIKYNDNGKQRSIAYRARYDIVQSSRIYHP
jgi:primary-amine oxidase